VWVLVLVLVPRLLDGLLCEVEYILWYLVRWYWYDI